MKLQIAVALSHNARLLIMDEPTSGLDPIVRNEIIQIFREYAEEKNHSILLSSHITSDIEKIADELVFINAGKIVLAGNKNEIVEKHKLVNSSSVADNKYEKKASLEDIMLYYVNKDN